MNSSNPSLRSCNRLFSKPNSLSDNSQRLPSLESDYSKMLKGVKNLSLHPQNMQLDLNPFNKTLPTTKISTARIPVTQHISFDMSAYDNLDVDVEIEEEDKIGDIELNLNATYTEKTLNKKQRTVMLSALHESIKDIDQMTNIRKASIETSQEQYKVPNYSRKNYHQNFYNKHQTHCKRTQDTLPTKGLLVNSAPNYEIDRNTLIDNKFNLSCSSSSMFDTDKELHIPDSYENFLAEVNMNLS